MIFLALFHTASPIQPPPLRGTSFHRKEGVSTRAPSLGRGCRAQRGGVGFLFGAEKPPPLCLPHWGNGTAQRCSGVLVNDALETISRSLSYHFPPSNLRPFGAPPSIGRRECPRKPLPLEGATERSEAGLASFLGGEAASSLPSPLRKEGCVTALGCSYIACLRRSPTLFHTASTLSGSLRLPPSPRGEGFVSALVFLRILYSL